MQVHLTVVLEGLIFAKVMVKVTGVKGPNIDPISIKLGGWMQERITGSKVKVTGSKVKVMGSKVKVKVTGVKCQIFENSMFQVLSPMKFFKSISD